MNNVWTIGYETLAVIQLVELILIYQLIKHINKLSLKIVNSNQNNKPVLSELEIGTKLPLFNGTATNGINVQLGGKNSYKSIYIFTSPNCEYCKNIIPQFRAIEIKENINIFVISKEGDSESLTFYEKILNLSDIPFFISHELIQLYKVKAYPIYFIVDENGNIIEKDIVNNLFIFDKYGLIKKQIIA